MQTDHWRSAFFKSILGTALEQHIGHFSQIIAQWESKQVSKETIKWQKQLKQLPQRKDVDLVIDSHVKLIANEPLTPGELQKTNAVLQNFMPWRKGPFEFFSINIDTEWRSDWKWDRVLPHIHDLANRKVLDVGCGSGYHLFRMFERGASQVVGIDPTALFFYQFHCFKQYITAANIHFLPVGIEHLPETRYFDTVFSMGVFYHRADPFKFLKELKQQMAPNAQLVLETLVIDGDENCVLLPKDRYAQMRNVWFIPSVAALTIWMQRAGFSDIKCVDEDVTSINEQRATAWMQNHSLIDFLDPNNNQKTIEGYPAPKRAVLIAS